MVSVAFLAFCVLALRNRRTPALHAPDMLATVILLASPSIGRLFANSEPGFLVRSIETLPNFGKALDAAFIITCVFCLLLIVRDYRIRQPIAPFAAALIVTIGMILSYCTVSNTTGYVAVADWFAVLPDWQITIATLAASGAIIAWAWYTPLPGQRSAGRDATRAATKETPRQDQPIT